MRNPGISLNLQRPHGITVLGLVATILAAASIVTVGLRLGPHYIDFRTIDSVMRGLPSTQIHEMTKSQIREMLTKRYKINNIRDLNLREVVAIERQKEQTTITVDYEIREPLVYNVDALLTFSETYSYR